MCRRKGDRRDDRAHQAGRRLTTPAAISRAAAGRGAHARRRPVRPNGGVAMSPIALPEAQPVPSRPAEEGVSPVADLGPRSCSRPTCWSSSSSCSTRSATGSGWRATRRATCKLFEDPIFSRSVVNTDRLPRRRHQPEDGRRARAVGLLRPGALVDQVAVDALHPAVGGAVDPDDPVGPLHAQPRVGRDQLADLPLHRADGPNWLNDPTLALAIAMLVHIWKSLPFWTLILIAGRLAIPAEHYEAACVDGATAGRSSASSPGRRCARSTSPARSCR